jgi:hypothetical protein
VAIVDALGLHQNPARRIGHALEYPPWRTPDIS